MSRSDTGDDRIEYDTDELFTIDSSATREMTPIDRLARTFEVYVSTPLSVAWDDWRTRLGLPLFLFFVLIGTVGPVIVPEPELHEGPQYVGAFESMQYPLGTDILGRSIGEQLVHSTPAMLKMLIAGGVFASGVGLIIGLVSGYKGGEVDRLLMSFTDTVLMIPGIPLILFLSMIWTPEDPFIVGTLLAVNNWPGMARGVRSQVLSIREKSAIEAARAQGVPTGRIVTHEILPQIAPYVVLTGSGAAASVIGESVGLYFLGILPFSTLNWGVMMNLALSQGNAVSSPSVAGHWLFWPALALAALSFSMTIFAQGLDRVFNPRLRARHSETVVEEDEPTSPLN